MKKRGRVKEGGVLGILKNVVARRPGVVRLVKQ